MDACKYLYNKYRDEFDGLFEVQWIKDDLYRLYEEGGLDKVLTFFLPSTSEEYIKDYLKLINKEDEYEKRLKRNN